MKFTDLPAEHALTTQAMQAAIDQVTAAPPGASKVCTFWARVGGERFKGGRVFPMIVGNVGIISSTNLEIHIPEDVAEALRQEGRRQLQAELRALINSPRA